MSEKIDQLLGYLHDARLYGFLLDVDPKTFDLNVLLYIHIFHTLKMKNIHWKRHWLFLKRHQFINLVLQTT